MINFQCPQCQKKIKAPDAAGGRRVPCPGCNSKITVPMADAPDPAIDDLKLQPDPLLDSLGMDEPAPKDPFGKAFDSFEPEPTPPSPPAPPAGNPYSSYAPAPIQNVSSVTLAFELPSTRQYWALGIIRIALLVLAALVAIGWLFSAGMILLNVFGAFASRSDAAGLAAGFGITYGVVTFFGSAITCCMLVASSELIKLAMDIQQNTLAAAHYARGR